MINRGLLETTTERRSFFYGPAIQAGLEAAAGAKKPTRLLFGTGSVMIIVPSRTEAKKMKTKSLNDQMNELLVDNGASLVGFADLRGLYCDADVTKLPRSEDSQTEPFDVPRYENGVAIAVAIPPEIVRGIKNAPTMAYYDAYHALNDKLDALANLCAEHLRKSGYNAYPQTVSATKEYGVFRTIMPHKTVALHAGLGWIGKSALFVTERFGSAIRLTSVLTDAPLDCAARVIQPKCGGCTICADACPAGAISGALWSAGKDREDFFHAMDCRLKAREIAAKTLDKKITLCGKCIEVCPYTQRYLNKA